MSIHSAPETSRFLSAAALVVVTLLLSSGHVEAQECDCSCAALNDLRSTMEAFQEKAEAGEPIMPPPELQQMAACAGQCAMACPGFSASTAAPTARIGIFS